ncbi:MAG: AAA family ATPase [Candidatus Altiarchaeales archaeon]|nr:AAA family ATPase [Candidatus Altiarchaeales archaeon]
MSENYVIIMRGISGSGKSTVVEALETSLYLEATAHREEPPPEFCIVSADHYMVDESGNYAFDPRRLSEVHKECLRKFMMQVVEKATDRSKYIVVDNTNTTTTEMSVYAQVALALDWKLKIFTCLCDPGIAFQRQRHGVPSANIYKQHLRLESEAKRIPMNWGHEVLFPGETDARVQEILRYLFKG